MLVSLGMEMQMVVSCHVGAEAGTLVFMVAQLKDERVYFSLLFLPITVGLA